MYNWMFYMAKRVYGNKWCFWFPICLQCKKRDRQQRDRGRLDREVKSEMWEAINTLKSWWASTEDVHLHLVPTYLQKGLMTQAVKGANFTFWCVFSFVVLALLLAFTVGERRGATEVEGAASRSAALSTYRYLLSPPLCFPSYRLLFLI